jgi:hypothetical protein
MSEKVVLPKFDIPSERTHPAVNAVKIVAGLLAVSLLLLGGATWRRHTAQLAAEHQRDALIAARVAEANAAIEAAKARVAEAAAKEAAAKADAAAKIEAAKEAKAKADGASKTAVAEDSHHHGHHHGKASPKGAKGAVAAKSSGDDKKSAPKSTRDNAAIDKLLAQFK